MELYPFYDFLLVVFGILCICVSIFAGNHENPEKNHRFGPIFLRILGVCFGALWVILPWIYRKMGIYAPINIEMLYMTWGYIPAFVSLVICFIACGVLVYFGLEWALPIISRFTKKFKRKE